jgi:hypothetical protein
MTKLDLRLGKQEYQFDERTARLANFMAPPPLPGHYDFDHGRAAFPLRVWGNDSYGNCVKAAQMNEILRLERIEQSRTIPATDQDVITAYKEETGCVSPGDSHDTGLVMLSNNKLWRAPGMRVTSKSAKDDYHHVYTISAFGELDPHDIEELKAAIYLLHGVQFGFALPRTAQAQTREGGIWDVDTTAPASDQRPGSWGGHAVYSKAYLRGGSFQVLTWGMKMYVTPGFIKKYCDEAWAVIDSFDSWKNRHEFDANKLLKYFHDLGVQIQG